GDDQVEGQRTDADEFVPVGHHDPDVFPIPYSRPNLPFHEVAVDHQSGNGHDSQCQSADTDQLPAPIAFVQSHVHLPEVVGQRILVVTLAQKLVGSAIDEEIITSNR